ncbi:hypothetical protein QUV58_01365 [Succinatimonas hippei]|uniref:hypothetical protein n=1 Tax=Succinatimonas hippei TaxID=626938 RepID=UPI0025A3CCFA|nr:hypothetical protein [Succinatimonas hippei]MDM8119456.1 hypothetical protein [Succinatimonas hippei]
MSQFIQQLNIYLKGGQVLNVPFNAEAPDKLNPQISAFLNALGDSEKASKNFLFQGQRPVLVHLPDVSAADVISLVRKEQNETAEQKEEIKE